MNWTFGVFLVGVGSLWSYGSLTGYLPEMLAYFFDNGALVPHNGGTQAISLIKNSPFIGNPGISSNYQPLPLGADGLPAIP